MANTVPNGTPAAPQGDNSGVIGNALGAAGNMLGAAFDVYGSASKILGATTTAANVTAGAQKVKSDFKNAIRDNQYHNKLAEEKNESAEKPKKKKDLAKYVPHLVGATLLTTAAARALKTGDVTQPIQDVRDGIKRLPAAVVNSFKKGKKVRGAVVKGAVDGAAAGAKATKGAPKAKVNNSWLSTMSLNVAKGTGRMIPYLAGAAYLDYKVKDAEEKAEKQRKLRAMHQGTEPIGLTAARTAIDVGKGYMEEDSGQKTAALKDIDWKNNGKDMIVDEFRKAVPVALATAGAYGAGKTLIDHAKRRTVKSVNDTIDDYELKIRRKKAEKKREMEKSAEVLHPNDRSFTEKNIRKLVSAGTIAAAAIPTMVVTEAVNRRLNKRARRKEEERRSIERKYRALQRQKEGGNEYANQQFRNYAEHPNGSQPAATVKLNISSKKR